MSRSDDQTARISTLFGNPVFEKAVAAMDLDPNLSRSVLDGALKAVGNHRNSVTVEDLGFLLPELDKRFRTALHEDAARQAIAGIRRLVLTRKRSEELAWGGDDEG